MSPGLELKDVRLAREKVSGSCPEIKPSYPLEDTVWESGVVHLSIVLTTASAIQHTNGLPMSRGCVGNLTKKMRSELRAPVKAFQLGHGLTFTDKLTLPLPRGPS